MSHQPPSPNDIAVSVIVPVYNTEAYVEACLQSLANQTFTQFEAILVDDGSTDSSGEIIDTWAKNDMRFVALHQENGGLSAARNAGLDAARGAYVAFLDSDDSYTTSALERLYTFASAHDLDLLDFTARSHYESDVRTRTSEGFETRTPIEGIMTGPELLCRYQALREYYCSACFHLIRRQMLEEHALRFREGIIHEDELFTPLLHAHAQRAAFLNVGLYERRVRAESIITRPRGTRNVTSLFEITQELHAWLIEHARDYNESFVDAFAQRIYELRDIMAHDAFIHCTEDEILQLRDTYSGRERIDFGIYVVQGRTSIQAIYDDVRNSTSYRLGDALLTLPRVLRR